MSLLGQSYYCLCGTRPGHAVVRRVVSALRGMGLLCEFKMLLDALALEHDAVAGLVKLWSRIHWSSGDGMMPPEQLLEMYRLAVDWPVEGDIVELGSWVGLTTSYLATACRVRGQGRVHAVDTFEGTMEGNTQYASITNFDGSTLNTFKRRIQQAGVDDLVDPMIGLTTEMAGQYRGDPIRLLLIDADHSYEGVRDDFKLWAPLVAPGGLIVFHDYLAFPDAVGRFVDEQVSKEAAIDMTPGHVVENVMAVTTRGLVPGASNVTPGDNTSATPTNRPEVMV